jgi:hypothetical protein
MKISFSVVFFILMIGFCRADLPTILKKLAEYLRVPKPLHILYNAALENKVILAKKMALTGLSIQWVDQLLTSETFLLVLIQEHDVIFENIQINQQVYFLNPSSDLFEKYIINHQIIMQKLGHFVNETYVPNISVEQNFLRRRQNFHGFEMIAMTEKIKTAILRMQHILKTIKHMMSPTTQFKVHFLIFGKILKQC